MGWYKEIQDSFYNLYRYIAINFCGATPYYEDLITYDMFLLWSLR